MLWAVELRRSIFAVTSLPIFHDISLRYFKIIYSRIDISLRYFAWYFMIFRYFASMFHFATHLSRVVWILLCFVLWANRNLELWRLIFYVTSLFLCMLDALTTLTRTPTLARAPTPTLHPARILTPTLTLTLTYICVCVLCCEVWSCGAQYLPWRQYFCAWWPGWLLTFQELLCKSFCVYVVS